MYGGYNADGAGIVLLLLYLVVSFLFFLLIRALVLWYFRINEIVKQLKMTNALLLEMAKVMVPNLPKVEGVHEIPPGLPETKEENDHIIKNWTKKDWDRFYETGVMRPHEPEPGEHQDK